MRKELQEYQQSGHLAEAAVADPHRLIQILFETAIERITTARGAMVQKHFALKGKSLGHALTIIAGLRAALDHERGEELSARLDALYDYMSRKLLEGSANNDPVSLTEVLDLLNQIKTGWDGIRNDIKRVSHPSEL